MKTIKKKKKSSEDSEIIPDTQDQGMDINTMRRNVLFNFFLF